VKVIDLNLLIYAINKDAPLHAASRVWWEGCLSGNDTIALPWTVILGFLRITTSGRIMPKPLNAGQATGIVDEWLHHPMVAPISPTERHWGILHRLLAALGTSGNLTMDAHLAALAIEHSATLYSADSDFARFRSLDWINPLL
jgi:uncharacterized protein